jgi:hypothetical protein
MVAIATTWQRWASTYALMLVIASTSHVSPSHSFSRPPIIPGASPLASRNDDSIIDHHAIVVVPILPLTLGRKIAIRLRGGITDDDDDETTTTTTSLIADADAILLGSIGIVASSTMMYSESALLRTGCGLPAGPYGLLGAVEGVSYLGTLGLVGYSLFTKIRTVSISSDGS